jgi:hypothetical protein
MVLMTGVFASAVRLSLEVGARKGTNVYLHGPANTGKSVLLAPLTHIYRTFHKPAGGGSFRLQKLEDAEIVLWNDWRFCPDIISWESLLLLGEGAPMMIPRPQNVFQGDYEHARALPVFITAKARMTHHDHREEAMMAARFRFFEFSVAVASPRAIPACAHCFARMVFAAPNLGAR